MTSPTFLIKRVTGQIATHLGMLFILLAFALVGVGPALAQEAAAPGFPLFRHIDSIAKPPTAFAQRNIRLLTDRDFPPFSYETPDGKTAGVSVDLALAACTELKAICTVIAKPFSELLPALLNNEGDVIVSGLRIDETVLKKATLFLVTRALCSARRQPVARQRHPQPCGTAHRPCGQFEPRGLAGKILFALSPHSFPERGRNE
jgi:ABC-type amino acid transport substrate-binding protein